MALLMLKAFNDIFRYYVCMYDQTTCAGQNSIQPGYWPNCIKQFFDPHHSEHCLITGPLLVHRCIEMPIQCPSAVWMCSPCSRWKTPLSTWSIPIMSPCQSLGAFVAVTRPWSLDATKKAQRCVHFVGTPWDFFNAWMLLLWYFYILFITFHIYIYIYIFWIGTLVWLKLVGQAPTQLSQVAPKTL